MPQLFVFHLDTKGAGLSLQEQQQDTPSISPGVLVTCPQPWSGRGRKVIVPCQWINQLGNREEARGGRWVYSRVCLGPKDSSGHRERQLTRGGQPKTSLLRPPKL